MLQDGYLYCLFAADQRFTNIFDLQVPEVLDRFPNTHLGFFFPSET